MHHILCFGNPLHGDDGFGHRLFHALPSHFHQSDNVRIFDAGTSGLTALPLLQNCASVMLIDAANFGAQAGVLWQSTADELLINHQPEAAISSHGNGVDFLVRAARTLGQLCPIHLLLLQAEPIQAFQEGLSKAAYDAIPKATDYVRQYIERCQS